MMRMTICISAMLASVGAQALGEDEISRGAFLRDYRDATTKIVDVYSHLKVECTKHMADRPDEKWDYSQDGKSMRWVEVDPKTGSSSALVSHAGLSFKLTRSSSSYPYTVLGMADSNPKALRSYVVSIEARTLPAYAPYRAYLEGPAATFLSDAKCTIKSLSRQGVAPDRTIRVEWEMPPSEPGGKVRYGKFVILPDAGWVLRSYEIFFKGAVKDEETGRLIDIGRGGDLEYRGAEGGIPLIHKVTTWSSGKIRVAEAVFEVTKISSGSVREADFTLASFGVETGPAVQSTPIMYPLLALSALCGIGAVLFRYLRNRADRTPAMA